MMVDAIVELTEPQAAGDITESHAKMRLVIEKLAAAGVFKSLALLLKINSSASDLRQENHRQKYEEIVCSIDSPQATRADCRSGLISRLPLLSASASKCDISRSLVK